MIYTIWLSQLPGIGPAYQRSLLREFGTPENVWRELNDSPEFCMHTLDSAKRTLEQCERLGIYLTPTEKLIPTGYTDLPIFLYCKGTVKSDTPSIGIVGSRRCTEYGKNMTLEAAGKLAEAGITIVSGLARGIDGYAHTAALKNNGYTIAVLGTGPDICFPSEHKKLKQAIEETGLVVSEYPPGQHGNKGTFPRRNRIIAALSDRILVTEAEKNSGALLTAAYANNYKKPVFAIPGRIDSPESEGCNLMIREGQAKPWLLDMNLPDYHQEKLELIQQNNNQSLVGSKLKKELLSCLNGKEKTNLHALKTDLEKKGEYSMKEITDLILELELDGVVFTEGDLIWRL